MVNKNSSKFLTGFQPPDMSHQVFLVLIGRLRRLSQGSGRDIFIKDHKCKMILPFLAIKLLLKLRVIEIKALIIRKLFNQFTFNYLMPKPKNKVLKRVPTNFLKKLV